MEILCIDNFLTIKSAKIELKRINIFIGPQAQGKSVITKLVSFFKEIPQFVFDSAVDEKNKREFDSALKSKFENMFPRYGWENTNFEVRYSNSYFSYTVACESSKLTVTCCENISKALVNARKTLRKAKEVLDSSRPRNRVSFMREVRDSVIHSIFKDSEEGFLENVIYIPAGRSFFAHLQKNVFSFISTSIPMDYFIKDFGAIYEHTRDLLGHVQMDRPKSVQKLVEDLIGGHYFVEKGQDWIRSEHGRVNVANSSSGQQEALPMALILSFWPYFRNFQAVRSFIIEEPEAHLFPSSQGQVVSLIASAYNAGNLANSYVVTTHSPYILTAFNNLIQAGNVSRLAGGDEEKLKNLYSIVPKEQVVNFDNVSAFFVNRGSVKSILDNDLRLIDAVAIDSISEVFSSKFEKLIEMEF